MSYTINMKINKEEALLIMQGLDSLRINKHAFPEEANTENKLISQISQELSMLEKYSTSINHCEAWSKWVGNG